MHLLGALMSHDNDARSEAEAQFQGLKESSPAVLLQTLTQILRECEDEQLRAFSAVLLRKSTTELWREAAVDAATRQLVKVGTPPRLRRAAPRRARALAAAGRACPQRAARATGRRTCWQVCTRSPCRTSATRYRTPSPASVRPQRTHDSRWAHVAGEVPSRQALARSSR